MHSPDNLLIVAALAWACSASSTALAQDAAKAPAAMVATLNAVDSRVYGNIRLEPTGKANELRAKVSVRGAPVDQQMPWEIRSGSCGEKGQQVGAQAAFRTISVRSDGSGDVSATLGITLAEGQTYSVNILASRADRDRVVACGVLTAA